MSDLSSQQQKCVAGLFINYLGTRKTTSNLKNRKKSISLNKRLFFRKLFQAILTR